MRAAAGAAASDARSSESVELSETAPIYAPAVRGDAWRGADAAAAGCRVGVVRVLRALCGAASVSSAAADTLLLPFRVGVIPRPHAFSGTT